MILRNRVKNPGALMRMGMGCLVVALVLPRFVHPSAGFGENLFDGFRGLFFGLSIGLNLWAVTLRNRPRPL